MQVDPQLIQNYTRITDSSAYEKYCGLSRIHEVSQPSDGVVMRYESFTPTQSLVCPFHMSKLPCFEFVYILSAEAFFSVENNGRSRIDMEVHSRTHGALYNREINGFCETLSQVPIQILHLYITPEKLSSLLGKDNRQVVEKLISDMNSRENHFVVTDPIQPAIEVIIHQIISRKFCAAADPLFVQGKIMELIAHQIEEYYGLPDRDCCLQPNDVAKLQMAKNLMMEHMSAPPSLDELARLVGLNQKKIKQGFRELFDTTVFGFLRRYRMEQAKLLFEKDMAGVSEVAGAVGYTNVSHFGVAFKNHHGVLPGEYRKSLKKKYLLNKKQLDT